MRSGYRLKTLRLHQIEQLQRQPIGALLAPFPFADGLLADIEIAGDTGCETCSRSRKARISAGDSFSTVIRHNAPKLCIVA